MADDEKEKRRKEKEKRRKEKEKEKRRKERERRKKEKERKEKERKDKEFEDITFPTYSLEVIENKIVEGKIITYYKELILKVDESISWGDYEDEFNETDGKCSFQFIDDIRFEFLDDNGEGRVSCWKEITPYYFNETREKSWYIIRCRKIKKKLNAE